MKCFRETPAPASRRGRRIRVVLAGFAALGLLCWPLAVVPTTAAPKKTKSAKTTKAVRSSGPGTRLYKRAEASFARKDYARTLALLDKAEAAGGVPKADVMNLRGAVHLRRGDHDKARKEFSAAASADRSLLAARYNLAEVDFEEGRYEKSRRRLAGLMRRAKSQEARQFIQYKALLADLLSGKEESAVQYLSERRSARGRPSAEFCYLSAALAYRNGKPEEARRWEARAPSRAPRSVRRLFAASLEKFGPRLTAASRSSADADNEKPAARPTIQKTAATAERDTPEAPASRGARSSSSVAESRSESGRPPAASSRSSSALAGSSGGSRRDEMPPSAPASEGAGSPAAATSPAAVAMVQILPEPAPNTAAARAASANPSPPASAAAASNSRPAAAPASTPARSREENNNNNNPAEAVPKFRFSETSATDSEYLLAAASPTPKPTPSGGSSPKPGAAGSPAATGTGGTPLRSATAPAQPAQTPEPPTEAFNQKYEAAFVAFSKRDYSTALQLLREADTIQPGQADPANLRGLIYARQRQFDQAEIEFKRAVQLDPTFWAAKFNLADLPFTYRNYGQARSRFESLLTEIDPTALPRESELTQFKIFLTLLLEGKEASARAFMSRFKFEGTTPARLYAQAALDFHEGNFERAVSWMESAKRQFPPQLEALFAESFFRIGWLTNTPGLAQADPATGTTMPGGGSSPAPLSTPGLSLAQTPESLANPTPILEPDGASSGGDLPALSLAPPGATAPALVAAATPSPAPTDAAASSPTPAASALAAVTPALPRGDVEATPSPALTPSLLASVPTPTPIPPRSDAAPEGSPAAEVRAQDGVERLVRVILPAFVALYVLFTPFFVVGAILLRKKKQARKTRQINVPLAYPSGKLARESKGESTS